MSTDQPDTPRDTASAERASSREVRLHLARLHGLAGRLDGQAALIRNGGRDLRAETRAGKLDDEAFAIRWALARIASGTERVRRNIAARPGIGGSS